MAEEAETKNNKKIIAIIAGAIVVIAAVVVTIILINNNKGKDNNNQSNNQTTTLNDDFFKSTDNKVVLSTTSNSTDPAVAKKVHQVYTIDGDKVTGLKVYSEFDSEESAKATDAKPEMEEGVKAGKYVDHKVEGKFIIVTMPESMYQSVTAEEIRATAAALEQAIQSGVDQQAQTQTQTQTQTQATETTTAESTSATEE
ncbi:hypothetical protein IKG48_02930 [Candidatus Saccharibacteria bacterium]|nr:hypothetical protein [Candidatus Saccharibacteria bacterium]